MASRPVAGLIAAAFAGAVGGFLLGRWSGSPTPTEHPVAAAPSIASNDREAVEELRREMQEQIRSLRSEMLATPAAQPTQREPVAVGADRLTEALERLTALLENGGRGQGSHASVAAPDSTDAWKGLGYPSLDAMRQRCDELLRAGDGKWERHSQEEFTTSHIFWRLDDVLARYGSPSRVGFDGGLYLTYGPVRLPKKTGDVAFELKDSLVVNVWIEWEDADE